MQIEPMLAACRKGLRFSAALVAAHLCAYALADEVGDVYGGISYSQTTAKDESSRNLGTYKPTTIGIGLSMVVVPNLALDGYVFTALNDSTQALTATSSMTVNAQEGYGFNLRPYMSLRPAWSIYAKLGRQYGTQETTIRRIAGAATTSTTYAHTIYGLGLSHNLDAHWGIGADYTRAKRIPSEQTSTSLISIGLRYKF